jgi:hypothetical protein
MIRSTALSQERAQACSTCRCESRVKGARAISSTRHTTRFFYGRWLWRGGSTRSHPELGSENPLRGWYCRGHPVGEYGAAGLSLDNARSDPRDQGGRLSFPPENGEGVQRGREQPEIQRKTGPLHLRVGSISFRRRENRSTCVNRDACAPPAGILGQAGAGGTPLRHSAAILI